MTTHAPKPAEPGLPPSPQPLADGARGPERVVVSVQNAGKCYHIYSKPSDRLKQTLGGAKVKVTAHPPDLLSVYVLLPGGKA